MKSLGETHFDEPVAIIVRLECIVSRQRARNIVSLCTGDYIHSKGLLFGMYTAMGAESCCGYPAFGCYTTEGGCQQAKRDVATYVSWGVDYIKVRRAAVHGIMPMSALHTPAACHACRLHLRDTMWYDVKRMHMSCWTACV
jgi:hypothetical protein